VTPDIFPRFRSCDLMLAASRGLSTELVEQVEAEVLLLCVYARFFEHAGAPTRPPAHAATAADANAYTHFFGEASAHALESATSPDFQLIAKSHVLGLMRSAQLECLSRKKARAMYSNALRFGHLLREMEIRFCLDRRAGTLVPLKFETQLLREDLEKLWRQNLPDESGEPLATPVQTPSAHAPASEFSGVHRPETDEAASWRGFREVLARLRRSGEGRPGLATYLGWLGRLDSGALSLLATPPPVLARAMRMQVAAVWGVGEGDEQAFEMASVTSSDIIEAVLLGAWLGDARAAMQEAQGGHMRKNTFGDDGGA